MIRRAENGLGGSINRQKPPTIPPPLDIDLGHPGRGRSVDGGGDGSILPAVNDLLPPVTQPNRQGQLDGVKPHHVGKKQTSLSSAAARGWRVT